MKQENENKKMQEEAVGDLLPLPNLSPGDFAFATKKQTLQWLADLMGFYERGDLHHEEGGGLTLQLVTENILRCVRVYDHPEPLKVLAMLKCTCEAAGVTLQLSYALLTPMPNYEEQEPQSASEPKTTGGDTPNRSKLPEGVVGASIESIGMEVV